MLTKKRFLTIAVLTLMTSLLLPAVAAAEVKWNLDLRARWEVWDAPSGNPALDPTFDFSHLRGRLGVDAKGGGRWSFHGVLQGAASYDLPGAGSFGIGPVYRNANGESGPSNVGLLELDVAYTGEVWKLKLGRQKWADGGETMTGVAYLDGVKKRRMAERLVGNWDWVNVGRRYDGVTFGATWDAFHLAGFALRPLQGGVNYRDAFEELDEVTVTGLTLTGRYGKTLSKGEWRIFDIEYQDDRPGALLAAGGGEIEVSTFGGSLLLGGPKGDVMVWVALQRGDWGLSDQDATAYIVEAGRQLVDRGGFKVTGRVGVAQASGDGNPADGDRESFFNLLPTNHKWYGSMDLSAFSNLRDVYLDATIAKGKTSLVVGLHRFELVETRDAWYGGSGPFNDFVFGYAGRRPVGGFDDASLGWELDVAATFKLPRKLKLDAGLSFFDGTAAAEEVLRVDADGTWGFLQLSWSR